MAIEFDASHVGSPNFVLGERAVWIFRVHQETKGFCHWLQNLSQAALQIFVPEGGICYEDQISMVEFIAATRRVGDPLIFLSLIHISEPTRRTPISYAVFCLN